MKAVLAALLFLPALVACSGPTESRQALDLRRTEDGGIYRLAELERAEAAGNADAANELAVIYSSGKLPYGGLVERNATRATEHTRRSAGLGDVVGRTNLGIAYIKGEGVPQDIAEGERLLGEVDAPYAHYWIGLLYAGDGPHPLDADTARRHLEIAAKGQVGAAAKLLAQLILSHALPSDDPQEDAARWYASGIDCFCVDCAYEAGRIRAGQGRWGEASTLWRWAVAEDRHYQAMIDLAQATLDGHIPAASPGVAALGWLSVHRLAGYGGDEAAALSATMSPADVAIAEEWARDFVDTYLAEARPHYRIQRILNGEPTG